MSAHCNLPEGFIAKAAVQISTDVNAMATGLGEFMSLNEPQRRQMGLAGRVLVESAYSWKTVALQMASCYQWILGTGPKPATVFEG
jgi:glycosyltransferase involved in cell wall biosynthesis